MASRSRKGDVCQFVWLREWKCRHRRDYRKEFSSFQEMVNCTKLYQFSIVSRLLINGRQVPKRLVKTSQFPDLSTTVLDKKWQNPIAVAPVGVQRIFNPDGEEASAAAAAAEGIPYIMSTASATSIEDVAKANGNGVRWYQVSCLNEQGSRDPLLTYLCWSCTGRRMITTTSPSLYCPERRNSASLPCS